MERPNQVAAAARFNPCVTALAFVFALLAAQVLHAQTLTVLHTFSGLDGLSPYSGVVMDQGGNLYGTTYAGGPNQLGTVYELKRHGSSYVHLELYSFKGGDDGAQPYGGVTFGPSGTLYGTTWTGGGGFGSGTVYSLRPSATPCRTVICPWNEFLRYDLQQLDSVNPAFGNVAFDVAGNLYGTSTFGGLSEYGNVYELSRSGSGWTGSVIFGFNDEVDYPAHNVIFDTAGNLYGTAVGPGNGGIFQLVPSGGSWTAHILAYFGQPNTCAGYDASGLIMDAAGNFYGTTSGDGRSACVFELANVDGTWQFTVLYTFNFTNHGQAAVGNMVFDHSGNLYGTTMQLGAFGMGNIFKMTHANGGWTYSDVYDFNDSGDGANPTGDLIIDSAGNIYGTNQGDSSGHGVVWEWTP